MNNLYNAIDRELYISVDVEADGPGPLVNSLLQIGAVPFTLGKGLLLPKTYIANIDPLPDAKRDPNTTIEFWDKHPGLYEKVRQHARPAQVVIPEFCHWVEELAQEYKQAPICACYPCGFDFSFVYTYCIKYYGKSPFGFRCFDAKSYAAATLKSRFKIGKRDFPVGWSDKSKHTHNALDDAVEQATMMIAMIRQNLA